MGMRYDHEWLLDLFGSDDSVLKLDSGAGGTTLGTCENGTECVMASK